jgi:hypothetical protein
MKNIGRKKTELNKTKIKIKNKNKNKIDNKNKNNSRKLRERMVEQLRFSRGTNDELKHV